MKTLLEYLASGKKQKEYSCLCDEAMTNIVGFLESKGFEEFTCKIEETDEFVISQELKNIFFKIMKTSTTKQYMYYKITDNQYDIYFAEPDEVSNKNPYFSIRITNTDDHPIYTCNIFYSFGLSAEYSNELKKNTLHEFYKEVNKYFDWK